MKYKFKVGDLVRVEEPGLPESGSLALVIGRRRVRCVPHDELYTLMLSGGVLADAFLNSLTKVNKNDV